MENQHRKISGYRDLTAEDIDWMNKVKAEEDVVAQLWVAISTGTGPTNRWMRLARHLFALAFMSLNRAIARPVDPFEVHLDELMDEIAGP